MAIHFAIRGNARRSALEVRAAAALCDHIILLEVLRAVRLQVVIKNIAGVDVQRLFELMKSCD